MKKNNNLMATLGTVPFAGIIVGALIAGVVSFLVVQGGINASYRDTLMNHSADGVQVRIDQILRQLRNQANNMATSIRLSELVANADPASRALEEARLREMMPYAIRVRMFQVGEARIERDVDPPFNFTALDMVNKIEQGATVYPEAINAANRWVIGLAAPIRPPSDATTRGILFIYLDITAISDVLQENLTGKVSLIQSYANVPETEFLSLGSGGPISIDRQLINENWRVRYNPDETVTQAALGGIALHMTPLAILMVISMAGVVVGLQRIIMNVRKDAGLLQNQIADAASGSHKPKTDYFFSEFLELDNNLTRLGKKEVERKPVKPLNVKANPKASAKPDAEQSDLELLDDGTYAELDLEEEGLDADIEFETEAAEEEPAIDVSAIFRAYDIRGVVGVTLNEDIAFRIGQAIGTEADALGETTMVVAGDGRLSTPMLMDALIKGLASTGLDIVNIGLAPTPMLYYATHNSEARSGVMVTGSHNPVDHNGFKIVLDGRTLVDEDIQRIYQRYLSEDFATGNGNVTEIDIRDDYIDAIADDVVVAQPLKIVVDCGNGIAGEVAPDLLGSLGCEVIPLYCDVDGNFPNHHPDPIDPENLEDLILTVKSQDADIGIAVDGDGDRLVAVTKEGEVIWPDRLLMLFAKDVVSRNPGSDVVYDVKCTRHLNSVISGFGGRPIISRSGHSFMKARMAETDAVLGGEMSGHICFKERWYGFDDALYSAARLLEIVGAQTAGLSELMEEFPNSYATPEITIPVADSHKFDIVEKLKSLDGFEEATLTTIDGLRVDFADAWGLVRASNTNPCLTLRFEADDPDGLEEIQTLFREKLAEVDPALRF